jgi:predicted DNA repair protein MutK
MLWVGGGIIVHGLEHFHFSTVPHLVAQGSMAVQTWPVIGGIASWLVSALGGALVGFVLGVVIVTPVHFVPKRSH